MNRRTVLGTVAVGLAGALAGCSGADSTGDGNETDENETDENETNGTEPTDDASEGESNGTDEDDENETDEGENATDAPPEDDENETDGGSDESNESGGSESNSVGSTQFQARSSNCGQGAEEATITFPSASSVEVEGVISGDNACYRARLGDVTVESGTLTATVERYVSEDGPGECEDCVIDISYNATFGLREDGPDRAVVYHDDEEVATAER
ncbi:hypothetical protein [Halomarina ordinaria]|uniref:Lipoprotein n=1 Tax=Halomarina ordinaria TaxID=3033939 RepID=A0ABD5UAL1_9EURY|nr:hypothetical protein [Halomarina sp. PSRA2]